jgi:hypothetical protein
MKFLTKILLLVIIDFCIIWFWVRTMNLDPSASIGINLLIPFVIVINLTIAGILFFFKKQYSKFFLINAGISAFIINFLFSAEISRHQRAGLESWEFKYNNRIYEIVHWKSEGTFSMSEQLDPGASLQFLEGKFIESNKEYYLTTDSTKYVIRKNILYGFGNGSKGIALKNK